MGGGYSYINAAVEITASTYRVTVEHWAIAPFRGFTFGFYKRSLCQADIEKHPECLIDETAGDRSFNTISCRVCLLVPSVNPI